MKLVITEDQIKFLLSEQVHVLSEEMTLIYQTIINTMLSKKYDWFKKIQIKELRYRDSYSILGISGVIEVDEEWGAKQWMEYHHSSPFPGNTYFQTGQIFDSVSFGDIIGDDFSKEIKKEFKSVFSALTGSKVMEFSFSNVLTKFV
jgi:hypothetical protein